MNSDERRFLPFALMQALSFAYKESDDDTLKFAGH